MSYLTCEKCGSESLVDVDGKGRFPPELSALAQAMLTVRQVRCPTSRCATDHLTHESPCHAGAALTGGGPHRDQPYRRDLMRALSPTLPQARMIRRSIAAATAPARVSTASLV